MLSSTSDKVRVSGTSVSYTHLFLRERLVKDGRLLVRYRDGDAAGEGKLEDYACYSLALLALYRVTFQMDYLKRAVAWTKLLLEQFFDRENGGCYLYANCLLYTSHALSGEEQKGVYPEMPVLRQPASSRRILPYL